MYKDKDSPIPGHWQIKEWKFQRCPLVYIDSDVFWFIEGYSFLHRGILPNKGGWLDQTAKFIQAMTLIENVYSELKEQRRGKK